MGFLNIFEFGKEDNVDKMLIRILENFEGRLEFFESEIVELKNRNPVPFLEIKKIQSDIQRLCVEVINEIINNNEYSISSGFRDDIKKLAMGDRQLNLEIDRINKQTEYIIRNLKTGHYKQQAANDNNPPNPVKESKQNKKVD